MRRTTVGDLAGSAANVASPHADIEGRQLPIRVISYDNIGPAGGIYSTALDMTRWLRFQLGDGEWLGRRLVSAGSMNARHEPWTMIPTRRRCAGAGR